MSHIESGRAMVGRAEMNMAKRWVRMMKRRKDIVVVFGVKLMLMCDVMIDE